MSNQNPYELLGVTEDSSFEEIQAAKARLATQYAGDRPQLETIEAAYDAVLMERLKLRQEGKIKVPDRIRYAERTPTAVASPPAISVQPPSWLANWVEIPSLQPAAGVAAVALGLATLAVVLPQPQTLQMVLVAGLGGSFYWLYRKHNQFWRSLLLSLGGLISGFSLGMGVSGLVQPTLAQLQVTPVSCTTAITLVVLGVLSLFCR